jgi:hypothetical protein
VNHSVPRNYLLEPTSDASQHLKDVETTSSISTWPFPFQAVPWYIVPYLSECCTTHKQLPISHPLPFSHLKLLPNSSRHPPIQKSLWLSVIDLLSCLFEFLTQRVYRHLNHFPARHTAGQGNEIGCIFASLHNTTHSKCNIAVYKDHTQK